MTLAHGTDWIESERLLLRRIVQGDLEFFARIHADPEVARYLGHGRPRSLQESLTWLQSIFSTYEAFALGPLAVLRKSDGALIGRCGLSDVAIETKPIAAALPRAWYVRSQAPIDAKLVFERELGYTFDRSKWGHGYASEAVRCVFEYACTMLRLPRVISLIHAGNARSLRVARKFGLQHEDTVDLMTLAYDRYAWPIPSALSDSPVEP